MNCPIKCRKDNGERYEIVDSPFGGKTCTCPFCSCSCQAVYKKEALLDIKCAQVIRKRRISNEMNVVTPHESKLQTSTSIVQNMLKRNVEESKVPSNAQNLFAIKSKVSKVEEYAYDTTATMLGPILHQHPEFIQQFRSDTEDQMKPGVRTMIMINGKKEDVRSLHNSNLWHHRQVNNSLKPDIIASVKSPKIIDLSTDDRKRSGTQSTSQEIINILDESNETASLEYDLNLYKPEAGEVYDQIVQYCFAQDHEYVSVEDRVAYRELFVHLTEQRLGCETCRYTCELMVRKGASKLDDIINRLLVLLPVHNRSQFYGNM